jgi:hypothetical protein
MCKRPPSGVVADGTQDIERKEQCVRYVTEDYEVTEDFLGLYSISSSAGSAVSDAIRDALVRLQLPIEFLRAQMYDGASNMSGKLSGCQTEIKKLQQLALYVHCGCIKNGRSCAVYTRCP